MKKTLSFIIPTLLSLIITAAYICISLTQYSEIKPINAVCNGFTVSGAFFLLVGCLAYGFSGGPLTGLGYLFGYALRALVPGQGSRARVSYREYREKKQERNSTPLILLAVGAADIAISLIIILLK